MSPRSRDRRSSRAGAPAGGNPSARRAADGERAAERFLRSAGYAVAARNLRTRAAEIDLLVRRRRLWIAVEVKTRRAHPAPERCLSPAQRTRLRRALCDLAPTLRPRPAALRVDVVGVRQGEHGLEVTHFPGTPFDPPAP